MCNQLLNNIKRYKWREWHDLKNNKNVPLWQPKTHWGPCFFGNGTVLTVMNGSEVTATVLIICDLETDEKLTVLTQKVNPQATHSVLRYLGYFRSAHKPLLQNWLLSMMKNSLSDYLWSVHKSTAHNQNKTITKLTGTFQSFHKPRSPYFFATVPHSMQYCVFLSDYLKSAHKSTAHKQS
jgi:hypothetical protein